MSPRAALRLAGCAALVLAAGAATHVAAPAGARVAAVGYAASLAAGPRAITAPDDTLRARLGMRGADAPRPDDAGVARRGVLLGARVAADAGRARRDRHRARLPLRGRAVHDHAARRRARAAVAEGRWRAAAVSLAYVDQALGRDSYLFRVDGGVFETDAPGALMDVAAHPSWLDSLGSREWTADRALVNGADDAAVRDLLARFTRSPYADSLYAIFGRPDRPAGVVGERGRAAGRLGEYVASRDSLALDPGG